MKIDIKCNKCHSENKAELTDNFILKFKCNKCKSNEEIELSLEKFQVLFDLGIICLKNGYYKEAVSDFAASLERVFEFSIKRILNRRNIEKELINSIWKEVKNQSERQYGAFIFLYAYEFKKEFKLDNKQIKFRNEVIHKGKFPNFDETYEYAKYIYYNIYNILLEFAQNGYTDDYNSKFKYNLIPRDEYISFISPYGFIHDQTGEIKPTPDFDNKYMKFYVDEKFIFAKG